MSYTIDQEKYLLTLIKGRRKQLQEERAGLKQSKLLTDRQAEQIQSELDELWALENKNREQWS